MEVEVGEEVGETSVPGVGAPMRLRLFRARWIRGGPKLIDHDRVDWFAPAALVELDWHDADRDLLRALDLNDPPTEQPPGCGARADDAPI